jgi:chromosome segregation ATPase
MQQRDRNRARVCFGLLSLVIAAGSVGTLGGCDQGDPTANAVNTASSQVKAAGVTSWSAEGLSKGVGAAATTAAGAVSQGTSGEKASSAVLTAQAAMAQAEKEAQAISFADASIRRHLSRMNELAGTWSLRSSIAAAAESFDPAPQIAALAKTSADKDKELAATTARRDEMRARLNSLRADSEKALADAKSFADQASLLRQQASAMSAREGASLVEQAAGVRRQGDAQRLIGEKLAAEAEVLAPQVAEQEELINKLNNQKAKLAQGKKDLEDRKAASNKEAADARELANQANRELETVYDDVKRLHDGDFQTAFDNAKGQFEKAAGAARSAADAGSTAKTIAGSAALSIAGLQSTRLQMLSSVASTLDVLTKTQPALPRKGDYQSRRTQVAEESVKLLEEAKASIEQATSAFGGANVQGAAREQLQQVAERLKKLPEQLEPPPADGIPRSARKFVEEMITATKEANRESMIAMAHTTNDAEKGLVEAQADLMVAMKKLDDAAKAKFEMSAIDLISKAPGGQMVAGQLKAGDPTGWDISTMTFTKVSDSKVNVAIPGSPMPMELVLVDGAWKSGLGQMGAMAEMITPMMKGMGTAFGGIADRVAAGEFSDAAAAGAAVMQEMQKAMMGGG